MITIITHIIVVIIVTWFCKTRWTSSLTSKKSCTSCPNWRERLFGQCPKENGFCYKRCSLRWYEWGVTWYVGRVTWPASWYRQMREACTMYPFARLASSGGQVVRETPPKKSGPICTWARKENLMTSHWLAWDHSSSDNEGVAGCLPEATGTNMQISWNGFC